MDNNQVPNPKCNSCHCYWKPDDTDIKPSGLVCKTCKRCRDKIKEYNKKYYEQNPDKRKEWDKKYREQNADKVKESHKKYYEQNPDKRKEYDKKYREQNPDKVKESKKEWCEKNPEYYKEYDKKYREQNPDKFKEYHKKYNEKRKCEHNKGHGKCKICNLPLYLINIQRHQINRCFKSSSQNKTKSSIEYLGCDAEYFIKYFQTKMDKWNETNDIKMTWENIHIDHIKPVSAFNLDDEEQFLDCCNYTNMQPLLAEDNLSKNNKWSVECDEYWYDNIKGKEYMGIYNPNV